MTPETHIFLDTNSFIQLRDLKDLKWPSIVGGASTIILLVSPTIIDELDQQKNGTNRRRRDRARAALKLIDSASQAEGFRLELSQKAGVTVYLAIADDPAPVWSNHPKLDPKRADDRLVAEALTHEPAAYLLSHDNGPRIRARLAGLSALAPPDDWLLPPEQTDDQRKMASMQRDLDEARNAKPRLELQLSNQEENGEILLLMFDPPPLQSTTVRALTNMYCAMNPVADLEVAPSNSVILGALYSGQYVQKYDADRYYGKYDEWRQKVEDHFRNLHEHVARRTQIQEIIATVTNVGSISAKDLVFEAWLEGGEGLLADVEAGEDIFGSITPKDAPEPPRKNTFHNSALSAFPSQRPTNPTAFRWIKRPGYGNFYLSQTCADFRPERVSQRPICILTLDPDRPPSRLQVSIGAEHHPVITKDAAITTRRQTASWTDEAVLDLFPGEIAATITRSEVGTSSA